MSQLYDRHSQFPVIFLYIAQKPAIGGFFMVGLFGFEPKTSSMSTKRSNQLSYNPMSDECIIHDMREICKMLFCNFLHMARQMRYPRCNSPSCYGSQFRRSTPPSLSASNPSVRTPKSKQVQELLLCTCPQIVCTWRYLRNQTFRHHYTSEYPALQDPVRRGIRIIVAWWSFQSWVQTQLPSKRIIFL